MSPPLYRRLSFLLLLCVCEHYSDITQGSDVDTWRAGRPSLLLDLLFETFCKIMNKGLQTDLWLLTDLHMFTHSTEVIDSFSSSCMSGQAGRAVLAQLTLKRGISVWASTILGSCNLK